MKAIRESRLESRDELNSPTLDVFSRLAYVLSPTLWATYAIVIFAMALAALIRWALVALIGPNLSPFITFYPLIIVVALIFGTGPGVVATVLAGVEVAYFFLAPAGLEVGQPSDIVGLALFCGINVALSFICGAFRSARHRSFTEARRAKASEERFRLFMDNTPTLAWVKDDQGRYVYVNKAYEKRFGVSLVQYQGKNDLQLWPAEVAARLQEADLAALTAGHPIEVTEDVIDADGSRSFWLDTKFPFQDASGGRFIASIGLDITPRKLAEETLLERARLDQLRADATLALQQPAAIKELLQAVAALLVERLDAAFARVWTLNRTGDTLELLASAGLYTHLNGDHARVPVGQFKIGRIAESRRAIGYQSGHRRSACAAPGLGAPRKAGRFRRVPAHRRGPPAGRGGSFRASHTFAGSG